MAISSDVVAGKWKDYSRGDGGSKLLSHSSSIYEADHMKKPGSILKVIKLPGSWLQL